MDNLLLIIIGILILIIFVLLAKIYFLRKSAQEIHDAFLDRLTADTNILIDISTRDPYMRKLAEAINMLLRANVSHRQECLSHLQGTACQLCGYSDQRSVPQRRLPAVCCIAILTRICNKNLSFCVGIVQDQASHIRNRDSAGSWIFNAVNFGDDRCINLGFFKS